MKLRKLNRVLHRDLGYIFFGLTIVYSISGIALNHLHHWNPNYIIKHKEVEIGYTLNKEDITKSKAIDILEIFGEGKNYKKYYFPSENVLKIFIKEGSVTVNINSGKGFIESIKRRPLFKDLNFLHYNNPKQLWTWVSDIFAFALILVAITGLFILKGKNGITKRGAWLTLSGVILPILFLLFYSWL